MRTPFILLLMSLLGMAAAWSVPDLALLAGLSALASLVLLLLAWRRKPEARPDAAQPSKGLFRKRRPKQAEKWIVVDGSNVMYWNDNTPKLETVLAVVQQLVALGYAPGVMFDANAGHLLDGRYMHDGAMGKELGLPKERVMVVPKGVPADPYILTAARDLGARIVTNDRYRDWWGDHPEAAEPGHLIKGGYRDGALWLDMNG